MVRWIGLCGVAAAAGCGPASITVDSGGTAGTESTGASVGSMSAASNDGGVCPIGGAGCDCTAGGACDPGLTCIDERCTDPECPIGSFGCACTAGGACDGDLQCARGVCVDAADGTIDPSVTDDDPSVGDATDDDPTTDGGSGQCGNGLIDPGEECDDGDPIQGNGCNLDCTPSGTELWTVSYGGPEDLDDEARAVAVDSTGAIIVVGFRTSAGTGRDILARKLESNGALIWERSHTGAGVLDDEAWGVAVDSQDNVVVAGMLLETIDLRYAWLRKYDPAGQTDWTQTYTSALGTATAFDVAIDSADEIVLAGLTLVLGQGENFLLRKYDAGGGVQWSVVEDNANGSNDNARGVATDDTDIRVVGYLGAPSSQGYAAGYGTNGSLAWGDAVASTTGLWGVATDDVGNVYMSGSGGGAARLHKVSASGQPIWTQTHQPAGGSAEAMDVAVDGTGAVVIVGYDHTGADYRIFAQKHGPDGSTYWTRTYAGTASSTIFETACGVAIDPDDNVIVVGHEHAGGQNDWWVRKYSP